MNKPLRVTHKRELQQIAAQLEHELDKIAGGPGKLGFVLLIVPYDQDHAFGDYVATCAPENVATVLREAAQSIEGVPNAPTA